jgi:hypothetical protein
VLPRGCLQCAGLLFRPKGRILYADRVAECLGIKVKKTASKSSGPEIPICKIALDREGAEVEKQEKFRRRAGEMSIKYLSLLFSGDEFALNRL